MAIALDCGLLLVNYASLLFLLPHYLNINLLHWADNSTKYYVLALLNESTALTTYRSYTATSRFMEQ